jgi:hypothetical protein
MLDDIRELMDKQPFEPFRIVLTSGDRIQIDNPHNLAVGDARIGYFPPRSNRWIMIRSNQIAMLESADQAA